MFEREREREREREKERERERKRERETMINRNRPSVQRSHSPQGYNVESTLFFNLSQESTYFMTSPLFSVVAKRALARTSLDAT